MTLTDARSVRVSVAVASINAEPDGRTPGEGDADCGVLFHDRGESDDQLLGRAGHLLGVLRARAVALDAWRHDATRLSLRAPWPIPAFFGVGVATRRAQVSLRCVLETRDAYAPADDAPVVWVQHTVTAPLATPRAGRLGHLVELVHAAIRHEADEFLFVDDRRVRDPHDLHHRLTPPAPTPTPPPDQGATPMTDDTTEPAPLLAVPAPKRVVKLTLTIEQGRLAAATQGEEEVLAEDFLVQADDESDPHFVARAAVLLGVLRHRSGTPPAPRDLFTPTPDVDARPGLPHVGIEREHVERLEALVRSWGALGDAVLAGLLTVYGLHHEAGAVGPGTLPREALRRYVSLRDAPPTSPHRDPTDARRDLAAVLALIAALEARERGRASAP